MDSPIHTAQSGRIHRSVQFLFAKFIQPKSVDQDSARREFIFNTLITAAILLSGIGLIIILLQRVAAGVFYTDRGVSPYAAIGIVAFFVVLLLLSRRGWTKTAAHIFIIILFLEVIYTVYYWGIDLPQGLLSLALIIIMSGILISTRYSLVIASLSTIALIVLGHLQISGALGITSYWRDERVSYEDLIVFVATIAVLFSVSWLANREIEKSLHRARISEEELRKQRDNLEEIVEQRTRELKQAQLEKMSQLYRFAEFGRHASGVFHELVNPLTAVSLNIQQVKDTAEPQLADAKKSLDKAFSATKKMEKFIEAVRRQLQSQKIDTEFSLVTEINQSIPIVEHKAKKMHVTITFDPSPTDITTYGDPLKFNQVISNLLSNALDALRQPRHLQTS